VCRVLQVLLASWPKVVLPVEHGLSGVSSQGAVHLMTHGTWQMRAHVISTRSI